MEDGIRINCIVPGTVETPWIDRIIAEYPDPAAAKAARVIDGGMTAHQSNHPDQTVSAVAESPGARPGKIRAVDRSILFA